MLYTERLRTGSLCYVSPDYAETERSYSSYLRLAAHSMLFQAHVLNQESQHASINQPVHRWGHKSVDYEHSLVLQEPAPQIPHPSLPHAVRRPQAMKRMEESDAQGH